MIKILNDIKRLFPLACIVLCMIFPSCEEDAGKIEMAKVTGEFTSGTTEILTSSTVAFEDQSTGDVTHWSWTFEGGTPDKSNVHNPEVTYNEPGTYEVRLVVSNAISTDVMVKSDYIVVIQAPEPVTADFSADKVSILTGESITFTDQSSSLPTTWAWEFIPETGNPMTSSEQNPVITFENEGVYSVKLTAANGEYSGEVLKEDYITVVDASAVAADFEADTRQTYTGQTVTFTDQSVGTVTNWEWTFEGGTPASSTDQNPQVTYDTAGKFKVTLVASNDAKISTKEEVGYITIIPGSGLVTFIPFSGNSDDIGPLNLVTENSHGLVSFNGTDRADNSDATAVFDGTGYLKINPNDNKQFVASYSVGIWMRTDSPEQIWLWTEGRQDDDAAWFRISSSASEISFLPQKGAIIKTTLEEFIYDNNWHYVVCVRNAGMGEGKIYVDGSLVSEKSFAANDLTNNYGFLIGAYNKGSDDIANIFSGQLDDLVIYNRALTEDEITLLSGF